MGRAAGGAACERITSGRRPGATPPRSCVGGRRGVAIGISNNPSWGWCWCAGSQELSNLSSIYISSHAGGITSQYWHFCRVGAANLAGGPRPRNKERTNRPGTKEAGQETPAPRQQPLEQEQWPPAPRRREAGKSRAWGRGREEEEQARRVAPRVRWGGEWLGREVLAGQARRRHRRGVAATPKSGWLPRHAASTGYPARLSCSTPSIFAPSRLPPLSLPPPPPRPKGASAADRDRRLTSIRMRSRSVLPP